MVSTYRPTGEGGDGALLEGRLDIDPDTGCVGLRRPEDGSLVTLVFPADEINAVGSAIDYGGRSYAAGDPITVGGGDITDPASASDYLIAPCPDDAVFMVAQTD